MSNLWTLWIVPQALLLAAQMLRLGGAAVELIDCRMLVLTSRGC